MAKKVLKLNKISDTVITKETEESTIQKALEESGIEAFETKEAREDFIRQLDCDPDSVPSVARLLYSTRPDLRVIGHEVIVDQIEKAYRSLKKLYKMTLDDDFQLGEPSDYDNYQRAILSPIMNGAVIGVSVEGNEQLTIPVIEQMERESGTEEVADYIRGISKKFANEIKASAADKDETVH